jgi:2-methylcitrate dehydratase PrpD
VSASRGATADLAAFASGRGEAAGGRTVELGRGLVDTVGCALAGRDSAPEALVRQWVAREGTVGRSTIWTTGEQVSASQAALVNGTAAHALDWDDVSPRGAFHPSVVLLPALVAYAEEAGAGGPDLASAYDVGAAVFRAVAHVLPRAEHYRRGWHTTATVGRLAAVAGLANLAGLDETTARNALGLVASLGGGSLANFGTMTKPLHAGVAARDAIMAVALASAGFTANTRQLEADGGFFALYGAPTKGGLDGLAADLEHWRTAWPSDWGLKRFPACYATHRAVDAALDLRTELAGRLPRRLEVVVEPGGLRPLIDYPPATGPEARFSMAYAVSAALVHGSLRLEHFETASLSDPRVRALMETVVVREADRPPFGEPSFPEGFSTVTAELSSDDVRRRRVDITHGDARNPMSEADLESKFDDCCGAAGVPRADASHLIAVLRGLPEGRIDALREALQAGREGLA